jgi:hypothetical protein
MDIGLVSCVCYDEEECSAGLDTSFERWSRLESEEAVGGMERAAKR